MTALTTLADAGRQIEAERRALLALLEVAERNVERGLGDGQLRIAVERVKAAQA